jgi:NifB/MoaA-like Fe-S oxidoreductase
VLDLNTNAAEADNYNKYVVVGCPACDKADMEPIATFDDLKQNLEKFRLADEKSKEAKISTDQINDAITTYAQNNKIIFVQNMIEFLKDNQLFLENFRGALFDMAQMSLEFKTKIEESN